jgi:hypothetical protein
LLVGAAGAGPEFDGGLVCFLVAVDVHALAVDLQGAGAGAGAGDGPVLARYLNDYTLCMTGDRRLGPARWLHGGRERPLPCG